MATNLFLAANRTVLERSTFVYTATLKDEAGAAIPLASLTTLKLTLYNTADDAIINSRQDQNVLNANGVTVGTTNGLLTWIATVADNVVVGNVAVGATEEHVAQFEFTYGGKTGRKKLTILVEAMKYVPGPGA